MDRISFLPRNIHHEILSRLPEKDCTRTSALSKTWKEIWSTFPFLVFAEPRYGIGWLSVHGNSPQQLEDLQRRRKKFLESVETTLLRFQDAQLIIKEVKLITGISVANPVFPCIDHWLDLAKKCSVEVLDLKLLRPYVYKREYYYLSPKVLQYKSLVKLILCGCVRIDRAFLNVKSSLRVLSLSNMYLGEDQNLIQNIISCCRELEYITLKKCSGLRSISLHNLPMLKGVEIIGLEEVGVDAPSLENFHYTAPGFDVPWEFNVDKCSNLRWLVLAQLSDIVITDEWLLELFGKFPLLERLELNKCEMDKRILISSLRLKVLWLTDCHSLELAVINAPNLTSCRYSGDGYCEPVISILNSSSQLEVDALFKFLTHGYLGFQDLRKILQHLKPSSVVASMMIHQPFIEFNSELHKDNSVPPPSIKHLKLDVVSFRLDWCLPLVTSFLWCCRPAIISLKLNHDVCSRICAVLLCENLMGRNEDKCACSSSHIKCWWHGLKNVKVTSSSMASERVDLKSFLEKLPTLPEGEEITFMLE